MGKKIRSKYSYKILELSKLLKIVGKGKRKKKIIMCHGNFDVVHPGHVRHLIYAKSKADILLVSITADKFITKGVNRPYVPENIRALNLAAFEMVDFVIIDRNSKPIDNIKKIKPEFFAKGFEYGSRGLPPPTKEELDTVESYGGQMIFTPGDVVYSSTKFLNILQPRIQEDKLIDLMDRNRISFNNLYKILKKFKNLKVHVVGDLIIDTYTKTSLIGGHTKTPTPSVLFQDKIDYIGGAGIVADHLRKAGAKVKLTTVVGNDKLKKWAESELISRGVKINLIVDSTRPTTNKNTIISNDYRLLKIDTLENQPISENIANRISNFIKKETCDVIIFSDFRHGIFNENNIKRFTKCIKPGIFKVADSQVASRWGNIAQFKEFDLITPNEKEARFSLGDQDSSISELTRKLHKFSNFKNLILKLGPRGIVSVFNDGNNAYSFVLPSFAENVLDAVGSGDALLAYSTLTMVSTGSLIKSSIIGSIAAACECEVDGNVPIKLETIKNKIHRLEELLKYKS